MLKRNRSALAALGLLAAAAFALAGCSGDSGVSSTTPPAGDPNAIITTNGSEPEKPLFPADTNEVGGGMILDAIFAGLAHYDATGALMNDAAESITIESPTQLTARLKEGQTFTDGTPLTAESFTKAWNYGAQRSNDQQNQSWFADIEGFSAEADTVLTGLAVIDELTFTITLNSPVAADFATRLGYSAYYPLPEAAYEDPEGFGANPIGNGPYKLKGEGSWQRGVQIDLVKNGDYTGDREAKNGGLTIVFYASPEAAYVDLLAGNVDVIEGLPEAALPTFEEDLGDRAINQPAASFESLTIPQNLPHFAGEEGVLRRQAISRAIDRDDITETIYNGTRTPARDFTTPVAEGWSDSIEGSDVLTYDEEEAQRLWAEADEISPWSGSFRIAYSSDSDNQRWVDAVSTSLKRTLGIDASGATYADLAALRAAIDDRTITMAFPSSRQAEYPALYDFLRPVYRTGAPANDGDYSNPQFDDLLAQGAAQTDPAAAIEDYQRAETILLDDLPAIPLWYQNVVGGVADTLSNVAVGWNSKPLFYQITKN